MKKRYYIAYGSNLNIRQMLSRCPNAKIAGTSSIPNYRLLFRGSMTGAYLTIEPQDGGSVPVAVWTVDAHDELALDRYEGFPRFYYKKELVLPITGIRSGKVRKRTAFVYIMHEDRPLGVPSGNYVLTCMEGYEDFGFDLAPLMNACAESRQGVQS
ncbi:MAG: gamma-glutamylcyclotransferase [Clostridiales bacterium]|nr:gamma-glutamylcyclotransferase [Clostridiales bacterium]